MKYGLFAALAMAGILAAQVGLTYAFNFQVAETISKAAISVLFFHSVLRMCRKKRQAA